MTEYRSYVRVECIDYPPHDLFVPYDPDQYPAPCPQCAVSDLLYYLDQMKHRHHWWRRQPVTRWLCRVALALGLIRGYDAGPCRSGGWCVRGAR